MDIKFIQKNENVIYYFLIFAIITSYFLGFVLNENSSGGAIVDFENTKRNLNTFKNNNFIEAIKATSSIDEKVFRSTRAPGFYVFNKYLNPFLNNFRLHQAYTTVISLLAPLFVFLSLRIQFNDLKNYHCLFFSSIILLSPYFRSTSFWGNEENLGIIFVAISGFFFSKFFKSFSSKNNWILLTCLIFFSSLVVYCDQKLVIIPLIILISILNSKKNLQSKIYSIFLYLIFSLPFLYLIKIWGNIVPTGDGLDRKINFLSGNFNYHYFVFSMSIISFYLFPFYFLSIDKKKNIYYLIKNKSNLIFSIIFLFFLSYFLLIFKMQNIYYIGGGVFNQISKILFEKEIFKKIFLSLVFLFSWFMFINFFKNNVINFIILIFFPFFSLIISPALFQEYFDPLFLLLIFIYLKNKYEMKNLKLNIFIFLYFSIFLLISIIYY